MKHVLFPGSQIRILILLWILICSYTNLPAQRLDPGTMKTMKALASYTTAHGKDRTTMMLQETGFLPPEHMKASWNNLPAVHKLAIAYRAAGPEGEKMLAMLAKNLAQLYESVHYEQGLSSFLKMETLPRERIRFNYQLVGINKNTEIALPVKDAILSISKYSDARALGGVSGILKRYYNLPDEVICDILSTSANNEEALLRGLDKASIPPAQKERIKNVVTALQESYESARTNETFQEANKVVSRERFEQKPPPAFTNKGGAGNTTRYEEHIKGIESADFKTLKADPYHFGGIVLGNDVVADTATIKNKLQRVVWIKDQQRGPVHSNFILSTKPRPGWLVMCCGKMYMLRMKSCSRLKAIIKKGKV